MIPRVRKDNYRPAPDASAGTPSRRDRQEIVVPISCPCPLQRIPDLRTGRLLLTSRLQGLLASRDQGCLVLAHVRPEGHSRHGSIAERGRSEALCHLEASMTLPRTCGAPILGGLVASDRFPGRDERQGCDGVRRRRRVFPISTANTSTNPTKIAAGVIA